MSGAVRERLAERVIAARWEAGAAGLQRLEDGRPVRVLFPGIPGGGAGPDYRGAVLDIAGDEVRGDVELHAAASGWRAHGHQDDPGYAGVVLHIVGRNDSSVSATPHGCGRSVPIGVLAAGREPEAGVLPPCAASPRSAAEREAALIELGRERLRLKAARAAGAFAGGPPGETLYRLMVEQLGAGPNRAAFAELARSLPLAALLERCAPGRFEGIAVPVSRARLAEAELRGAAALLILRRAGSRPLAAPGPRLALAARAVTALWSGTETGWPPALTPDGSLAALRNCGLSRALAVEVMVNAVLPAASAARVWPPAAVDAVFLALPSPGTYGRLRRLESWLALDGSRPFAGAAALQGGLLLQAESCMKGACGRCPLSRDTLPAMRIQELFSAPAGDGPSG